MEDIYNALCWTMIRDSSDSHPGPTVTVTHDCIKEIYTCTDALADLEGGGVTGFAPPFKFQK